MKNVAKFFCVVAVWLCLVSMQVFAQEPAFPPPTSALVPCEAEMTEPIPCDIIVTQAEDILGVWAVYFGGEPAYIRFNADGTFQTAADPNNIDGAPEDYPSADYTIDETGIFTTSHSIVLEIPGYEGREDCIAGRYLARVIKMGDQPVALNLSVLGDCFDPRRTDYAYALVWVGE
jgi:hypothetical protein